LEKFFFQVLQHWNLPGLGVRVGYDSQLESIVFPLLSCCVTVVVLGLAQKVIDLIRKRIQGQTQSLTRRFINAKQSKNQVEVHSPDRE
jgi:hypothetical protein